MDTRRATYHLVRPPARGGEAPRLDAAQQAVADHPGGPLLVLAGPGTGKTTAIVETVADRVSNRGTDPERVLVLTFSRKAAGELRERITARLGRTTREPLALTFHSYAYGLVRREFVLVGDEPPTLLSGPEQLLEVRRLLRGEAEDGGSHWPERLRVTLGTRGFATDLRDFLLRAAERGLDGPGLTRLGRQRGRDDWEAAGGFLDRYAARFDLAPLPAYDYAEIVRIAASLLSRGAVRDRERKAYDVVLVDEYQDTDPAQEALLHALAGDGRDLIVVGDPDQSVYAFRGADLTGVGRFPDRFRTPGGQPAAVIALRRSRRSGAALLAASRRVAARLPVPPLLTATMSAAPQDPLDTVNGAEPAGTGTGGMGPAGPGPAGTAAPGVAGHRLLEASPELPAGTLRVITAASASQEAAVVADTLRRAHLHDGVPWAEMAVLVRSVVRQAPLLRRALAAAGVPAVVAGDELPLEAEPGAQPLLALLRAALHPGTLDEDAATELLTGPLGGTDALGIRKLRRALLEQDAGTGAETAGDVPGTPGVPHGGPPGEGSRADAAPSWRGPLAAALADARELTLIHGPAADAARRVAALLSTAQQTARRGSAHDVLWAVWDACGLAPAWQAASAAGGSRGAAADRDLDAVCALFDAAARFTARLPPGSPWLFLDSMTGQEIAGDTLAERAPPGDVVRILTAHRAKGLEWDVVVVAGVQEGVWPDLRLRSSLLGMDELMDTAAGVTDPVGGDALAAALAAKLLQEERRLFYVAVTRARRALTVTATGGGDTDERPSRFLAELAGDAIEIEQVAGTARRWLSLPALTADLRRAAADPARPQELRQAAAGQLAQLASAGVRGAHPRQWYQLTNLSAPGGLAVPGGAPVRLSPSQVESFSRCGLRWLLEAAVGARTQDVVRHFGTVIHAVAVLAASGASESLIETRLDEVWRHLDFGSRWFSDKQREQAQRMVSKFLAWHRANPRELVAVEQPVRARIGAVEITGRIDRLERDGEGRAVVVDLKTSSAPAPSGEMDRHPQLGVYQLAVLLGAFERFGLIEPGGAELVQVGKASLSAQVRIQQQRPLSEDPEPEWARRLVETVAGGMAGPLFRATVNPGCRVCPVKSCCPVHTDGEQVTP